MKEFFAILSVVIAAVSYAPYIRSVLQGQTKPHVFSWLVWGISSGIVFVAQLVSGGGTGSWATGFSAAICIGIGILAIFKGEKDITRSDWFSFWATLAAIPLWLMMDDPLWSVILITAIDTVAYYPTYRKSFAKPYEELSFKYLLTAIKFLLTLLALDAFTVTTALYPVVSLVMEIGIVALLFWRRRVIPRPCLP